MTQDEIVKAAKKAMEEKLERLAEKERQINKQIEVLKNGRKNIMDEAFNLQRGIEYLEKGEVPESTPTEAPNCPKCKSDNLHKDGLKKKEGRDPMQKWKCLECGKKFALPMESFEISSEPRKQSRPDNIKRDRTDFSQTGKTNSAIDYVKQRIDAGESLLISTVQKDTELSNGIIWLAMKRTVEAEPNKYEWFKDVTKKYHLKGMRLTDENKRKNAEKQAVFCPECKTLMLPGQNCVKCN